MCGIFAWFSPDSPTCAETVERAVAALTHRGPDEQDHWRSDDGRVALGHARLSIIDLETGHQPLANEDGSVHLVASGEFYDYERIQQALMARGHHLASRSDSEIALHLYEEAGEGCLRQLRGEFAFVIYDAARRKVFAARDRFGIKPLFYAQVGGQLFIASEVKALFAAGVGARWSSPGVYQALHFAQRASDTLFEGIHQLPPGHALAFEQGRLKITRYWDVAYPRKRAGYALSEDEEHELVRTQLEEAVRVRTRADVPLGCYLSGGVDSSAVLALARRMTGKNIPAFSVSFDHPDFDERSVAEEMAAFAGVDFHPLCVSAQDFAGVFEAAVLQGEMIQYNGHAPARYLLSRFVRDAGIKSVLGGEGADELFGGYGFAQRTLQPGRSRLGASAVWRFIKPPGDHPLASFSPVLARIASAVGVPDPMMALMEQRLGMYQGLLSVDFLRAQQKVDPYRVFLRQFRLRELVGREPYKIITALWLKSHFVNYVLAGERLDMGHAVELRLPFLDHVLFENLRSIPASHLVRHGENKHLLRHLARDVVCPSVLHGAKKPFFAPPGSGDDALHTLFQDLLRSESFKRLPFFEHARALTLLDEVAKTAPEERSVLDPILYLLASFAVLQQGYNLGESAP